MMGMDISKFGGNLDFNVTSDGSREPVSNCKNGALLPKKTLVSTGLSRKKT